jgi:hypothetical protein
MFLNSVDHINLTDKIVLLKKEAFTILPTAHYKYRLRRVAYCFSDPGGNATYLVTARFPSERYNQITTAWSRDMIEGWLTEDDAQKLLMWEALSI